MRVLEVRLDTKKSKRPKRSLLKKKMKKKKNFSIKMRALTSNFSSSRSADSSSPSTS